MRLTSIARHLAAVSCAFVLAGCKNGPADLNGVVVNEIRARGGDFVEFFNAGTERIDLSGYRVADGQGTDMPRLDLAITLDDGTFVDPGQYLVVFANLPGAAPGVQDICGTDGPPTCYHAAWGISGAGDTLFLIAPGGKMLSESYPAEATLEPNSWGRLPNGSGSFAPNTATPGRSNQPAADVDAGVPDGGIVCGEPSIIEPIWVAGAAGAREALGAFGKPDAIFVDGDLLLAGDEDPAFEKLLVFDIASDQAGVTSDPLTSVADFLADPGPAGSAPMEFTGISGFAGSATGEIYVVEQGNVRIQVIRKVGDGRSAPFYEHVRFMGVRAPDPEAPTDGQFVRPQAARVDSMGRLYISDDAKWNNPAARRDVQVFDPDGTFLFKFGDASYGPLGEMGNLSEPENFVIDEARDRIYVCDEAPGNIAAYRFSDRGFVTRFGSELTATPNGIDIDEFGNLYVVDEEAGVRVFDPDTLTEIFRFGGISTAEDLTPGLFFSPDTLIIDRERDLLIVADQGHKRIQGFRLSEIQQRACILTMALMAPARFPAGDRSALRVDVRRRDGLRNWQGFHQTGRVTAEAGGAPIAIRPDTIEIVNGVGSLEFQIPTAATITGRVDLRVEVNGLSATRTIQVVAPSERRVSGTLRNEDLHWSPADGLLRVMGDVTVPTGQTLTIEAGTLVRIEPGATFEVRGAVLARGSTLEPIHITARDPVRPFTMIHHTGDEPSTYRSVFLSHGGAGPWTHDALRHCCVPMLYAEGGQLELERVVFADAPMAKGVLTESTNVTIRDSMFARMGFGTEHFTPAPHSALIEDSTYSEMRGIDDNDGIYLWQPGSASVVRTVVSGVDDDAIDTDSANPEVRDTILYGAGDKCISITNASPMLDNVLLVHSRVGIKVDAVVNPSRPLLRRVTFADLQEQGMRLSNREGATPNAELQPTFERAIFGPAPTLIATDFAPTDVTITQSVVPSPIDTSGTNTLVAAPGFIDAERFDYRPRPSSAAWQLDAGFRGW